MGTCDAPTTTVFLTTMMVKMVTKVGIECKLKPVMIQLQQQ